MGAYDLNFRHFMGVLLMLGLLQAKERIVALSPAINELIFAMDRGDWVVGNTQYASYPLQSQKVAKVGGFFDVSFEALLKLKPTLVIMQPHNTKFIKHLEAFGIGYALINVDRLQSIQEGIITIGTLLRNPQGAKSIVERIQTQLKSLQGITHNQKILMVIGDTIDFQKGVFIVGHGLYLHDIIEISGNHNAYASKLPQQPILSYENIIATQADILIILAPNSNRSQEVIKQAWSQLPIPAIQKGNIFVMQEEYVSIPSDRLVLFLEDFKKILEVSRKSK